MLPRDVIWAPSLEMLKIRFDVALGSLIWLEVSLHTAVVSWTKSPLRVSSTMMQSVNLCTQRWLLLLGLGQKFLVQVMEVGKRIKRGEHNLPSKAQRSHEGWGYNQQSASVQLTLISLFSLAGCGQLFAACSDEKYPRFV